MIQIAQLFALILLAVAFFAAMEPAQWLIGVALAFMLASLIKQVEESARAVVAALEEKQGA